MIVIAAESVSTICLSPALVVTSYLRFFPQLQPVTTALLR